MLCIICQPMLPLRVEAPITATDLGRKIKSKGFSIVLQIWTFSQVATLSRRRSQTGYDSQASSFLPLAPFVFCHPEEVACQGRKSTLKIRPHRLISTKKSIPAPGILIISNFVKPAWHSIFFNFALVYKNTGALLKI